MGFLRQNRRNWIIFYFLWLFQTLCSSSEAFIVLTDLSGDPDELYELQLFDSHLQNQKFTHLDQNFANFDNDNENTYTYRISHHKTEPWVHKVISLDPKSGILQLKPGFEAKSCQNPSKLKIYIDIQRTLENKFDDQIDFVSFPLTIVFKNHQNCHKKWTNEHIERSIDDLYVSLSVNGFSNGSYCLQMSQKVSNLFAFLPRTTREECEIEGQVDDKNDIFSIQSSTGDILMKKDWCLFDQIHNFDIKISLKCTDYRFTKKRLASWDQIVHFIIHKKVRKSGGNEVLVNNHVNLMDFSNLHHPIHRMRREMRNNQAPFFDQSLYIVSVPEEQPPGLTVSTLHANDPEGGHLTYSMTSLLDSRSSEFFTLDSKSGVVSTVSSLDREKIQVHYFRVMVADSGVPPRTGTSTLQINVQDVNDHEPKFEQNSYSVSVREGISVGSTIISVRATDQDIDKNGDINYSILNLHDVDDAFRIDPDTGLISTRLPLDRETRAEYTLIVQANDLSTSQLDRKSSTTTIRIELNDENDNYPQWSARSYNVTIPENFDSSNYPVIAKVSATDADEGVNSALRYSIIGGNSQNHFSIDSVTGEVSLVKSLDYETARSYRLNIRVIDSGNPSRSNNTQLIVNVEDLNDNGPRFYSPIFQETVQENLPLGSSVLRVQAFDPDDGQNAKINYRISYRDSGDKFPFDIESDSGWITTVRELDRETQNRFDFDVIASDSGDQITLSATASVVILLNDENDNNPVFSPKIYESAVSENDPPGTPITSVKATDPDENSRITYEITEGNLRNRFSISTQNGLGTIAIAQPLDFKNERKFVLTIKATDSGGRFDLATVYIDVQDANTHSPYFLNTPYSVKIFEDVPIGTTILVVSAQDLDSGLNAQLLYSFVADDDVGEGLGGPGEGSEAFTIDPNSGAITTTQALDREKVSGYILTVRVRDHGIPPLSDTTDVEIVLNDVNDNEPVFEREFYQAKVFEDIPIGTSILQVQATDADQGKNSIVRYAFSTFSDGDGTFSVDGASGIIRTVKSLDRESVSRYELMVLAIDNGSPELTGRTNVTIVILDINDSPPVFEGERIRFFIPENSPLGSTVGSIQAYDADEGSNADIQYSIVGGVDANLFTLVTHQQPGPGSSNFGGGGTADILTRIDLDFESSRKKYDIIVRAASPPLRNDVHVEIYVQDVNDNPPTLLPQFHVILNNFKGHFPIGPIGRVPAHDADITDQLKYTIVSGNKANLVFLNESTGLLTLSPYLDTNVQYTAKMDIIVSDGLNEAKSEMILKTRMITDDLLFNSVTVQLADLTTENFLSPLFQHFQAGLAQTLNTPKENIVIFSVQEEIEGAQGVLNVSFSARKSGSSEEFHDPDYIKERVFLNRLTLSKLSNLEVLAFSDDLCLLEPCPNFEECLTVLKFRNVSNFLATESMLFRSVLPWQTFACRCPKGFTGLNEHYLCDAEINLCFSSPCHNGGTCQRIESGFSCLCPAAYTGSQCQYRLDSDTCQPGLCSKTSTCQSRVRGGFLCGNCTKSEFVNQLCELTARSFSRGSYLTFPGIKSRYRLHLSMKFATQKRNGLLLYNGRYNERNDFISIQVLNSTLRFSFSLGSSRITSVQTGVKVDNGVWHSLEIKYFNKSVTLSVDNCDTVLNLENPGEFPSSTGCAALSTEILDQRCDLFTESCQRFLDLTGPLYLGGLPVSTSSSQIETQDFQGCIKDVYFNHKFIDLNNYVVEHATTSGCPEKKSFCSSYPCKNGGKCIEGWGTYSCRCLDGFSSKDCSEDAKPVWNLRDKSSYLLFTPQLRPIQFPWYNSLSLRTLDTSTGTLMIIRLSNNDSVTLGMDNGAIRFALSADFKTITVNLPKINNGHWNNIEVKWMTGEIWFSLNFGLYEVTLPVETPVQGLFVNQVIVGSDEVTGSSFSGCVQDVRVGGSKNYYRKPSSEFGIHEGCSMATACVGAVCPQRSTCVEEAGRHKCQCDPGYVGVHCVPICDLRPCKNNGTCVLDLSLTKGYRCKCDERYYGGVNCEEPVDLSCPPTWWGFPVCGPCSCLTEKNFSPECNKKSGQCKCKEYHYEKDTACIDCQCYSVGSISKNCDPDSGKCQCRSGVSGDRCDSCPNAFAEVTLKGCEVVFDGCPRAFSNDLWWPRTKFGTLAIHDCPSGAIGLATRKCELPPKGWGNSDLFNCTSTAFISLVNIVGQLDTGDLILTPLLSTKLAGDLQKALNTSINQSDKLLPFTGHGKIHLYGNDIYVSLRLLSHLIRHEVKQKGLNLSHRQDKNFISNLAFSTGKITSKEYADEFERLLELYGQGSETLLKLMEKYLGHLALNQEDTFTAPFEILTNNLVLGLDTVEVGVDIPKSQRNFEFLEIQSSVDLYDVKKTSKRAVRFPKYNNIVLNPSRYTSRVKYIIPLETLGLDENEIMGSAVVGYIEYNSLWDVLPKKFQKDVERRFNSDLVAYPPIVSLALLASRIGLQKGKQKCPIRITYEIIGKYIDSSNPQCVLWEESQNIDPLLLEIQGESRDTANGYGGWTTRSCTTEVEEHYVNKMGNVMTVNCTCWHLSTFAVLIENNDDTQDIPRPSLMEEIITYLAFGFSLILIFGALIALGLLKGPIPSTITNTIHKHLLWCIFSSALLYLLGIKLRIILVQNDIGCRSIAIGLHFFWLSTFAWLFASALHLRRIFTEVRDVNHGSSLFYFALGYAFPILCVSLSLGVRAHHYGNKFFCWLSLYEGIIWGMVGPILITVVGTLVTFLVAVRAAFTYKDQVVDSGNMRTLLWMDLTLLPICGFVWTLFLIGANERSSFWQYGAAASILGLSLYIALGYCILNQRVKESLYIRAGNLFRPRDATDSPSQHTPRSALAYNNGHGTSQGLRGDDLRRDIFLRSGARSFGISTASTTSRSTTKTSSSPYRSETFQGYGRSAGGDQGSDSVRKHHRRSRKRSGHHSDDDEGSSDGDRTMELASSHSSDEDEAIQPAIVHKNGGTGHRSATLGNGGGSTGNSGSDNEYPQNPAGPQEYKSNNLRESPPYGFPPHTNDEVNDLGVKLPQATHMSTFSHSTPTQFYQLAPMDQGQLPLESPIISPLQESPEDEDLEAERYHDRDLSYQYHQQVHEGIDNLGLDQIEDLGPPPNPPENPENPPGGGEEELYGGSITSGVLV